MSAWGAVAFGGAFLGAGLMVAWLGLVGTPLWAPLGIAILWGGFVFWKV